MQNQGNIKKGSVITVVCFGGVFMRKSVNIGLMSIFAALHSVLYFLPGPWRSWTMYLLPIEGIILGPKLGFAAAFIGSSIARMIKPTPLWMFGVIAEPIGVLVPGLLVKGRWKWVLSIYAIMLGAYFAHPFGRNLPLWTILDILFAFILIYPTAKMKRYLFGENVKLLPIALILISFVSIVADSLARVFLLIPAGLHTLFFGDFEVLFSVFVLGAMGSYVEDLLVVIVSVVVGVPLLVALQKIQTFRYPLT